MLTFSTGFFRAASVRLFDRRLQGWRAAYRQTARRPHSAIERWHMLTASTNLPREG